MKTDLNIYVVYLPSPWRQAAAHLATRFPILSCIRGETPANDKQSYRAIGEPNPCCDSPRSHICQCTNATLTRALRRRERRKESDRGATIKTEIHPFFFSPPFCSLYKFTIGPFWSLKGDGCSRIYCCSILRGGGYPESCERDHFCQPLSDSMWNCTVHSSYSISKSGGQYCLRFLSFVVIFAVSFLLKDNASLESFQPADKPHSLEIKNKRLGWVSMRNPMRFLVVSDVSIATV